MVRRFDASDAKQITTGKQHAGQPTRDEECKYCCHDEDDTANQNTYDEADVKTRVNEDDKDGLCKT